MKKIFMIFAVMLTIATTAIAGTPVKTNGIFENTYVSLNVGASGDITPNKWGYGDNTFFQTVRPTATLRFGKWVTPTFGVELQGEVGFGTMKVPTFVDHTYVGMNAMLNMNNLFHGYNGKADKVEFVPYAGIGWWHSYGYVTNNIATQYGVKVNVNLDKEQAWQLNIVPQITYLLAGDGACNNVRQPHFDVRNAYVGLQVGVTYKFPNQYGTHNFVLCDKKYTQEEVDKMNDYINHLRVQNDNLTQALIDCNNRPSKVETVVKVEERYVFQMPKIQFEKGSYEITPFSKAVLGEIAEVMKVTDKKWVILGYASNEGDDEFNQTLSLKRAEIVKQYLVGLGVSEDKLDVVGKGSTTKFSEEYLENNRVVEIID